MTMASSTTNPVEIVRAISDRLLRLNPNRYITPKVPTRDNGTATLGMVVAGRLRRNKKITNTTSTTDNNNSYCTSLTDSRMVIVRSVSTETFIPGGRELCNWGSSFLIRFTTSITLAPGCRWIFTITAGEMFIQAAWFTFSVSSIASATSDRNTGALLR